MNLSCIAGALMLASPIIALLVFTFREDWRMAVKLWGAVAVFFAILSLGAWLLERGGCL